MPFVFDVKVVPGSNHIRWELHNTILVCHHKNPDDSKTVNTDIINAVAQALGISHSKVHLAQGTEYRHKRFKISEDHYTFQDLVEKMGLGKKG